jgi:hypothetical protein
MSETLSEQSATAVGRRTVGEAARLALKLGFTAFGGPTAHIAMLREEVVTHRKSVTDAHLLISFGGLSHILAVDDHVLPFLYAWPTPW